jgi:5-methylcytosine-specific restriction endonuclease McrA
MFDQQSEMALNRIRGGYLTYVKDMCICQYCGFDGKQSPEHWAQLQIDHLIPTSKSPEFKDDFLNLVVACYYCNTQKKDFDPSYGKIKRVQDEETRKALIQNVAAYLENKKNKIWHYGGGFVKSYQYMMQGIPKK